MQAVAFCLGTPVHKPRILLADDHTLVAEAFKRLLEPEFEVVGTVADGRALLHQAPALQPDVVLVDLNMPLLNGLDAAKQLRTLSPRTKIIVVTMNEDADVAAEAMQKWASGYLLKKSAGSELLKAVRDVLHGSSYITPALNRVPAAQSATNATGEAPRVLTLRQREVLQLLAEGRTMKEVAAILRVTARTVAFHKYRIMREFQLKNNSELLRFAMRQGLMHPN
jgi:DNA-binding NarL/FixJ family response regulator